MAVPDFLTVNRRAVIVVPEGHSAGRYASRIEDIENDGVLLAAPTHKGAMLRLSEGQRIEVQIAWHDAVYCLSVRVEAMITDPIPLIRVAKPGRAERVQRREFVRVDVNLPVRYACLDEAPGEPAAYCGGSATSLSGGGLLLLTWHMPRSLRPGSRVKLQLELSRDTRVSAKGLVVRISTEETDRGQYYKLAIAFDEIDEKQRDMIVKHVLQRQFAMRRKGLL